MKEEKVLDGVSFAIGYTQGKQSGLSGFHRVRYFNDDRTTLLYTVFVPTGENAMYAGGWPKSANGVAAFRGFEPSAENVTSDLDCYAVYDSITTLDETPWADISAISESGQAQNYFAIGDEKEVFGSSTVGTLGVGEGLRAYIIGFDHNEEFEGKGIHFGTFKNKDGVNVCLVDSNRGMLMSGGKLAFNINHWTSESGSEFGGWGGCDLRYDILGSTDQAPSGYGGKTTEGRTGYDPTPNCTKNPVPGTLMAALPLELRSAMKPMTKYTDNSGNASNSEAAVTATIDYLPLLSPFEIIGDWSYSNQYEQYKQKQYPYFNSSGRRKKYSHKAPSTAVEWWLRSQSNNTVNAFTCGSTSGSYTTKALKYSYGLAPIFKV